MAACFIPSLPYMNNLAFATDWRNDGVLSPSRTAGSPGVTIGPLPLQLLPYGSQPSMTLFVVLRSELLIAIAAIELPPPEASSPDVEVTLLPPRSKSIGVPEPLGNVTVAFTSYSSV